MRSNLTLAVQRSTVDLSKAAVTTARVTPDWSVDIGLPTVDISNQGQATNFSAGLNIPIELGGKGGKRVHAALADVATAGFDYDDAVRQLRATAAGAFIASLSARDILQSSYKSLGEFDRIVEVNEQRVRVGDIGEIELMQSQVDRDQFKAGVISAQADVYSADLALAQQLGQAEKLSTQMPVPTGRLEVPIRTFDPDQLVASALQKRSDVLSRQRAIKAAELRIQLAQANLIPDLGVSGSYSHTGTGTGGFVQPPDNALGASLSVNLPFSRWRHQGEIETARASRTQAEAPTTLGTNSGGIRGTRCVLSLSGQRFATEALSGRCVKGGRSCAAGSTLRLSTWRRDPARSHRCPENVGNYLPCVFASACRSRECAGNS